MGITIENEADELSTPVSTGTVEFVEGPVTTEVVVDNGSTGAVKYDGPVTSTVSWVSSVETKPVVAPVDPSPVAEPIEKKPVTKPSKPSKVETK